MSLTVCYSDHSSGDLCGTVWEVGRYILGLSSWQMYLISSLLFTTAVIITSSFIILPDAGRYLALLDDWALNDDHYDEDEDLGDDEDYDEDDYYPEEDEFEAEEFEFILSCLEWTSPAFWLFLRVVGFLSVYLAVYLGLEFLGVDILHSDLQDIVPGQVRINGSEVSVQMIRSVLQNRSRTQQNSSSFSR